MPSVTRGRRAICKIMKHKYLWAPRIWLAVFAMVLLVGGVLQAKGKGDKLFKEGQVAESKQDWDRALELYQQALDEKPGDSAYTIAMRRARFQAGQMHVNLGG